MLFITRGENNSATGDKRTQYLGNNLLVFCHHELDSAFFTGDQMTQGAAVDIQTTSEQSGGVHLQEMFYVPVKPLGTIVGKQKKP
jgi:hypothetical protein